MTLPTSATPPQPMGAFTGYLLNWVGMKARAAFTDALTQLELTPPQFATMVVVDAAPGQAQQELVTATQIDPSTMVALLDDLESAGLAERRPHPTDRRKRAVHLTRRGQRQLAAAREAADALSTSVFSSLSAAELAELHRLLRRLADYAD